MKQPFGHQKALTLLAQGKTVKWIGRYYPIKTNEDQTVFYKVRGKRRHIWIRIENGRKCDRNWSIEYHSLWPSIPEEWAKDNKKKGKTFYLAV